MQPSSGIRLLVREVINNPLYVLSRRHEQVESFHIWFRCTIAGNEVDGYGAGELRFGWTRPLDGSLVTRSERMSLSFRLAVKSRLACSSTTSTFHRPGATCAMASRNPDDEIFRW